MRDLRTAHYKAMQDLGYSDEEIEKDFEQVLKDLKLWNEWLRQKAIAKEIQEGKRCPDNVPW